MTRTVWLALVTAITALCLSNAAEAAVTCSRHNTPGNYPNPRAWGTDSGILIDGFADLVDGTGHTYLAAPGTDISSNNFVDFKTLTSCGAAFAFVRMDNNTTSNWTNLLSNNIVPILYDFFNIPKNLRQSSLYSNTNSKEVETYMSEFSNIGATSEHSLEQNLTDTLVRPKSISHFGHEIISIDVEQTLTNDRTSSPQERVAYGRYYAHAVCSFITQLHNARPDVVPIMYTTPSVYGGYLLYAYPADFNCLQGFPIWMAWTTPEGGDIIRSSHDTVDQWSQRACLASGGNRCIIHQYSHRGLFATLGRGSPGQPSHIDLDRFFDVKVVPTSVGTEYVRSQSFVTTP